jgi:hypothetical protein
MSTSPGTRIESLPHERGGGVVAHLQCSTAVEPHHDLFGIHFAGACFERFMARAANEFMRDRGATHQFTLVLELHLAGDGGQGSVHVGNARHDLALALHDRALLGVGYHILQHRDRHALRYAAALVDALVVAGLEGHTLHDFAHEIGDALLERATIGPRFLLRDVHTEFDTRGIVRHDLAADAVLERRDDLAARRVVFGVGGEAEQHVELEAHGIAFDLHIPFLHDVEQPTCTLPARSGSSLSAKMPRLARGSMP